MIDILFLAPDTLPVFFKNPETAALVLKTLKKDNDMPALVFHWDPRGFNDVATAPNLRNGIAGQNVEAIIANLVANGAINYNNVVFAFPKGENIGDWCRQIDANIPWYE